MIRERILPAALLLMAFAVLLLLGRYAVEAAALGLFLAINWEFYSAALGGRGVLPAVAINSLLPLLFLLGGLQGWAAALIIGAVLLFLSEIVRRERERHEAPNVIELLLSGLAYPGVLGSVIVAVAHLAPLREIVLLVGVISLSDTAAYFGGSWWGGKKLAPRVSPNKTVSGAAIAFVLSGAAGALFASALKLEGSVVQHVLFGLAVSLLSQSGDLAESLFKRRLGVKDMGRMLGGHGGVLDRVDGYLFAAPLLLIWKFGWGP